jgi:hypothetical protein
LLFSLAADAYQGMANNIQQYGPSTVGEIGLAEVGVAAGLAGGGAIAELYEAGSLGSGALGTTIYYGSNAALGSGLSVASNATTQLIENGLQVSQLNTGELELSAILGAGFGTISGRLGVLESSIETNATQQEAELAFTLSLGRYLDVAEPELDTADAWAFQTAVNASTQTGAIWGVDTFGSPVVQSYLEGWLDAKLGFDSSGANSSGNRKGCGK